MPEKKPEPLLIKHDKREALRKLIDELKQLGGLTLKAEFSGGGDEGSINEITCEPETPETKAVCERPETDDMLNEILTNAGYDWWNNEGGFGTLTIDIKKGTLDLDMNINVQHSEAYPMKAKV